MEAIRIIASRELRSYFATPLAYVFIVIFLAMMGVFTFYIGGFYERANICNAITINVIKQNMLMLELAFA